MDTIVLVTALAVSADALAAGFALALGGRLTVWEIFAIGGIAFLMCLAAQTCAAAFSRLDGRAPGLLGGGILLCTGLRNLLTAGAPPRLSALRRRHGSAATAVGFAVGLDAAAAAFSLGVLGYRGLGVPLVFGAMHVLAVAVGSVLPAPKRRGRLADRIAAAILLALGIGKIVSACL